MAEEEQAAAKAAAKKAKKQRQKLKAKKQAQPEPSASAAEPHDAHTPSHDAPPLSPEPSQLSMDLPELSFSSGQHQAQGSQTHDLKQPLPPEQQQQVEAEGTSLSVSSALDAAAAPGNNAVDVAVELGGLHLPSCDHSANKGHTDADFLQQPFCCPLTKVSHVFDILDSQAFICTNAEVKQQCNAWVAGSQHQNQKSSAAHAYSPTCQSCTLILSSRTVQPCSWFKP